MEATLGIFLQKPVWVFVCLLVRLLPILALVPPSAGKTVPVKMRVGFAIVVALLLLPPALGTAQLPAERSSLVAAFVGELLFGGLLGSVFAMTIFSMQLAGQMVGQLAGLGGAAAGDHSEELPLIAKLFGWIALVVVLSSGTHRLLMQCALDSFERFPVGTCRFDSSWVGDLQAAISQSLSLGVRLAVPIGLALLMTNVLTGLIARSLPQLNTLSVGFSTNLIVLLIAMFLAIGGISWTYQHELTAWMDSCHAIAGGT